MAHRLLPAIGVDGRRRRRRTPLRRPQPPAGILDLWVMDSADAGFGRGPRAGRPAHRRDRTDHERPGGDRGVHPARGQGRRFVIVALRAGRDRGGRAPATTWPARASPRSERDPHGPLRPGDIVVVTSKIVSKAEDRRRPAADRDAAIPAETVGHGGPPRRRPDRPDPRRADPGRGGGGQLQRRPGRGAAAARRSRRESPTRLRPGCSDAAGGPVGVVISDTAGRPWRLGPDRPGHRRSRGRVLADYAGRRDRVRQRARVTARALADELAVGRRPGQGEAGRATGRRAPRTGALLAAADDAGSAADLVRPAGPGHVRPRDPGGGAGGRLCRHRPVARVRAVLRAGGARSWRTRWWPVRGVPGRGGAAPSRAGGFGVPRPGSVGMAPSG